MGAFVLGVVAYLIGSVSFARIVGGWRAPEVDLSEVEYHVAGTHERWVYRGVSATTVTKKIGLGWGVVVVALDLSKGLVPTFMTRSLWPAEDWHLVVGVLVVVGHVWPLWHRFVGGRGQSTLIGVVLVVSPLSLVVAILVGAVAGLLVFTSSHLARQGFGLYIWVWPLLRGGVDDVFYFGVAMSVVYLLAIRPDLREERRVQQSIGRADAYRNRLIAAWDQFTSDEG
jgi:glycerol-3-phosphate acyltransferase PlsY